MNATMEGEFIILPPAVCVLDSEIPFCPRQEKTGRHVVFAYFSVLVPLFHFHMCDYSSQ